MKKEIPTQIYKIATNKLIFYLKLLDNAKNGKRLSENYHALYIGDIANFVKFYKFVVVRNYRKAYVCMQDMDTCPRDMIPVTVYNWLINFGDL